MLAVKGIRTTWGTAPYTNQVFGYDATVIKRIEAAGAVLVAKTTLGELAVAKQYQDATEFHHKHPVIAAP